MTVLVQVALLAGATITPDYLRLGHPTLGLLGTGTLAATDAQTDYSDRIMSMSVQRTSSRRIGPVIEYNAGTATVTLLNDDGLLDPAVMDQVAPGVLIRLHKIHDGVVYPLFSGFVDSWLPEHRAPDHAVVTVTATDAMSRLAGYKRTALAVPVGAGEDTGARINRILDSVGWPAADRDIATGDTTLQATTLDGDALDEAQQATVNEIGEFYAKPTGVMYFRNRRGILTDTRSNTSNAVFGSGVGELPYVGRPGVSNDRTQLKNTLSVTREGGAEQIIVDEQSVDRYGEQPHQQKLLVETDADAAAWGSFVLGQDSRPEFRFTSLTVDGRLKPDLIMPQLLGRDFGDRITVVRRPPGGIVDSRDVFIRSIEHTWSSPDRWVTTWGLQPASKFAFFVLGDPAMGVLGQNQLAY